MRSFGWNEFTYILSAAQWTLSLSLIAFAGGMACGILIALARCSSIWWIKLASVIFIEIFQGTPLIMQLLLVFFGAAILGLDVSPWLAAGVAMTLHAGAYIGEIWRGSIEAIPRGQTEAAKALGLHYAKRMALVILPQAKRTALPPTFGFLGQLVKGTSLASVIGFTEITRAGQIINTATFQPFVVFGLVAGLYFLICWPLSLLSDFLEQRSAHFAH